MANLSGPGGMKQVPVLISYKDSQIMKDEKGEISSVYLNVQKLNAEKKTADPHPYLNPMRDGKAGSVAYKASQFEKLQAVGQPYSKDGINYLVAKTDIMHSKQDKNGNSKLIMNIPIKDELADKHPVTAYEGKLDGRLISRHNKNTQAAVEARNAKQAEAEMTKPEPAKEQEAEIGA